MADARRDVRDFFGRHAAAYAESASHRDGDDLVRLLELLAPGPREIALDVATATGHTAFALARRCAGVIGIDITPEMKGEFDRAAAEQRLANARFVRADAEAIPWRPATFDLVTSRRAPHHFPDLERAVAEMARVLKPGGRLGIADMTVPEEMETERFINRLEKIRDPSHHRARSRADWIGLALGAGLAVEAAEVREEALPWARWLRPVAADSEAGRAAREFAAAASAAERGGFLEEADGLWTVRKRRVVLVARKS